MLSSFILYYSTEKMSAAKYTQIMCCCCFFCYKVSIFYKVKIQTSMHVVCVSCTTFFSQFALCLSGWLVIINFHTCICPFHNILQSFCHVVVLLVKINFHICMCLLYNILQPFCPVVIWLVKINFHTCTCPLYNILQSFCHVFVWLVLQKLCVLCFRHIQSSVVYAKSFGWVEGLEVLPSDSPRGQCCCWDFQSSSC